MTNYLTRECKTATETSEPTQLTIQTYLDEAMLRQMPDNPALMAMVMNDVARITENKLRHLVRRITHRELPQWEHGKIKQ